MMLIVLNMFVDEFIGNDELVDSLRANFFLDLESMFGYLFSLAANIMVVGDYPTRVDIEDDLIAMGSEINDRFSSSVHQYLSLEDMWEYTEFILSIAVRLSELELSIIGLGFTSRDYNPYIMVSDVDLFYDTAGYLSGHLNVKMYLSTGTSGELFDVKAVPHLTYKRESVYQVGRVPHSCLLPMVREV